MSDRIVAVYVQFVEMYIEFENVQTMRDIQGIVRTRVFHKLRLSYIISFSWTNACK